MLIHVIQNGNQAGPYSPAQFDDLLQKGLLSGDDLYWHEGCDGWSPVSLHANFPQPVVLATPPPPPPRLAGVRRVGQQASTLKICRDCGHAVSPSAKSCPNCGKRLKLGCLPKLAIGFGGLVIVYIILLILFPPRGRTAGPTVAPPKAEAAFIAKVQSYVARYKAASNELQKTAVRSERAHGLAQVVTDMQVSGWVGTLKKLETTRDGQASIAIQLDGTPIKVCTAPGLLGTDSSTLIEPNSPLYDQLSSMAVGQEVRFSGSFLPDEHDHINETSLTEEGAMTEPEFVMRFSNVTVVQAGSASVAPVPAPAAVSSGSPPATLASPVPTVAPRRAQTAAAPLPEAETSFIDTVDSYISRYTAASNELQKSAVRTQRRAALARTITDMHVSGWIGTLKKLTTSPSGDASISIRLEGSAISVHTDFRNPFDQGSNTLIEHSSALYNKLASLSVGDRVVFSGSFQPGETDHLQETSFTESGSMTAPEFVMRFSEVAPASATSSSGLDASSQSSVARVEAPQGETVPPPLPATSSSALKTSPTPDSQVAPLSDAKFPVAVSVKRRTATADDDAPGDVLVAYKDGTSLLLTDGEISSQARFSPRTGTIGWVLNDPPTTRPGDGFVMSNPVRPRHTLVLYRDGRIIATLQSKLTFIEHWGFEEDGTKVVFQCRESHGPGLFQRFDVETGRLLATASENDDPFPEWAASWTVPTPAGPTREVGALPAALASPPSTSAPLLNQVTRAQPVLVEDSAASVTADTQTGSLAPDAAPTTAPAPNAGVSERLLIGKWQGARHLTEYRADHTRVMDGVSTNPPRTWHLEGDQLTEMPGKNVYKVVALDQNELVLEGDGGRRYSHERVSATAMVTETGGSLPERAMLSSDKGHLFVVRHAALAFPSYTDAVTALAAQGGYGAPVNLPGAVWVPPGTRPAFAGESRDRRLWLVRLPGADADVWLPRAAFDARDVPGNKAEGTLAAINSRAAQVRVSEQTEPATPERQTKPLIGLKLFEDERHTCRLLLPEDGWVPIAYPLRGARLALEGPGDTRLSVRPLDGAVGDRSLAVMFARAVKEHFPFDDVSIEPMKQDHLLGKSKRVCRIFSAQTRDHFEGVLQNMRDGPMKQGMLAGAGTTASKQLTLFAWIVISEGAVTWAVEMEDAVLAQNPAEVKSKIDESRNPYIRELINGFHQNRIDPVADYLSMRGAAAGSLERTIKESSFDADGLTPVIDPDKQAADPEVAKLWNFVMEVQAW